MGAAKAYLLLYNVAQSVGWAVALLQTVLAIARDGSHLNVYAAAGPTVSERSAALRCAALAGIGMQSLKGRCIVCTTQPYVCEVLMAMR